MPDQSATRPPPMEALVDLWERGQRLSPSRRLLALLRIARPEGVSTDPSALTVGQRDGLLLDLRRVMFGPSLDLQLGCPACGEIMEFSIPVESVLTTAPSWTPSPQVHEVQIDGQTLGFRVPTGEDMVALGEVEDATAARRQLLVASLIVPPSSPLGDHQLDALAGAILAADPQSDLRFAASCPACEAAVDGRLDPGDFLWRELHALVQRTLREVWTLARATGWSEAALLAMPTQRRALYLGQLQA